jgi:DNA-binding transcriptional ArsR family regulator
MTDVFDALADKNRRIILELVAASESLTTAALATKTKLSATVLEKHLKVLVEAELLTVVTKGKTSTYTLNKTGLGVAAKWFGKFGSAFVSNQADQLGENIGNLLSSAAEWLEKRVGAKINLDIDPEQAGRELGKKLSDAKREATVKVGDATVKVKVAAKKVKTKVASKKSAAKKPAAKKAPAKSAATKKPVAKKSAAKKPAARKPKA